VYNRLMGTGNYSATSNNVKLVHWPWAVTKCIDV